jgi:hypothetical protein
MAEAASQIKNDLQIIANARGRRHGAADALHPALTGSHSTFAFKSACCGWQHNVSEFSGFGIEKVLDQEEF